MDEDVGYSWVSEYERTWETLTEDQSGSLQTAVTNRVRQHKRRAQQISHDATTGHLKLGMMRHVYLAIDLSETMANTDYKPSRLKCTLHHLRRFVEEFFDQNPISQIGILSTADKRATRLSEMCGNLRRHVEVLSRLAAPDTLARCEGEPSLQNLLQTALASLRNAPSYTSHEVVMVLSSLTTCDAGDIEETIAELRRHRIRCSVIALSAEVYVQRRVCQQTDGVFAVAQDEAHLGELLARHLLPPAAHEGTATPIGAPGVGAQDGAGAGPQTAALIRMGFPRPVALGGGVQFCACHAEVCVAAGHVCPQCHAVHCELPVECGVCGLGLVSAPHLARAYHHLFALPPFTEEEVTQEVADTVSCAGCAAHISDVAYKCSGCTARFCIDCDIFLHDSLHSCPNCALQVT